MYETAYVQLLQRVAACRLTTTTKIIAMCNHTIIAGQNKLYFFISIICKFVDANHNNETRLVEPIENGKGRNMRHLCDTAEIILNLKHALLYDVCVASSTA